MRIRIAHETTYRYETPAKGVIQILRLTPRNHDGQQVLDWRIDVSADCRLDQLEDAFGNITHTFTAEPGGTRMVDVVNYELPLGILGALAHRFGVRRDLEGVFDYRRQIIAALFPPCPA